MKYNAFMSYSHAVDGALAPKLRESLHAFGRPLFRLRALNVFRDDSNLANTPALWPPIEDALRESEFFILMASPEAARSPWVERELRCWLANRPAQNILICVTAGEIAWNKATSDFDENRSSSIPSALFGVFGSEPRHTDLRWAVDPRHVSLDDSRWRECVVDIAATLHKQSKDELIGEDVRQHARARRWRRAAILALGTLAIAMGVSANLARRSAAEAHRQRDEALRRQSIFLAQLSRQCTVDGLTAQAVRLSLAALPKDLGEPGRPYVAQAEASLYEAVYYDTERIAFRGHDGPVWNVAVDKDEALVVTASSDKTVRLWNALTGDSVGVVQVGSPVSHMELNADATRILTVSWDDSVRLWDTKSKSLVGVLETDTTYSACFSPDGRRAVTLGPQHRIRLWSAASGDFIADLGHANPAWSAPDEFPVVFRPDGTRGIVIGDGRIASLVDLESGRMITPMSHSARVQCAAFSPNDGMILTGGIDGVARIWSADGQRIGVLGRHQRRLVSVSLIDNGTMASTVDESGTVRGWDARRRVSTFLGKESHLCPPHLAEDGFNNTCEAWRAFLRPDGRRAVVLYTDGTAVLWAVDDPNGTPTVLAHQGHAGTVVFLPDRKTIAVTSGAVFPEADKHVSIFNTDNGRLLTTLNHESAIFDIAIGKRSGTMITGCFDRAAHLFDIRSPSMDTQESPGLRGQVSALVFSLDGRRLVIADGLRPARRSFDSAVGVWDTVSGDSIVIDHQPDRWCTFAAFNSDGSLLVTAGGDSVAKVWDGATGSPVALLRGHAKVVDSASFDPEGTRVVTVCGPDPPQVFEARTGRLLFTLAGHTDEVVSALYDASGSRIVTASRDRTARIWSAATGDSLRTLHHPAGVTSAAFSADGARILTSSDDGTVRLWEPVRGSVSYQEALHRGGETNARFIDAGQRILACSRDLTATILDPTRVERPILVGQSNDFMAIMAGLTDVKSTSSAGGGNDNTGYFGGVDVSEKHGSIVIALNSRNASLYDLHTGARLLTLPPEDSEITVVSYSPIGDRLAIGTRKGTVRILKLLPRGQGLIDLARRRVPQPLSAADLVAPAR